MVVGDKVTLTAPFAVSYPGTYTVVRVNADGACGIDLPGYDDPDYPGADFDPKFLVKV